MKAESNDRPPPRRIRLKLLVCAAAGVLTLLAVEGGLRLAGISHPQPYYPDDYCGVRLWPGLSGWWSREGGAAFHINSYGFRDREHSIARPAGTLRIAVVGDSYVEAFQVDESRMFGRVMERIVSSAVEADPELNVSAVEVLNFGVSGYATAQELLVLRHHVWQFNPDIVLLAFLPSNDVRGNSRELEPMRVRPFFDLVDGKLIPDFSFRRHPAFLYAKKPSTRLKAQIINASRIVQVIQAFRTRADQRSANSGNGKKAGQEAGLDDLCFREPADAAWQAAWQLTEKLIEQMHVEVTERGSRFVVAVLTSGMQIHPDVNERRKYMRRLNVDDLEYSNRRIERLGQRLGFPTVILSRPMGQFAREHRLPLHGFENTAFNQGHWNVDGHRVAGEICAEAVLQELRRRPADGRGRLDIGDMKAD